MLGHKMVQVLSARFLDTWCTLRGRKDAPALAPVAALRTERVHEGVDVTDFAALEALLRALRPDAVVNCVGVIKQRAEAAAAIPSITTNSLLPHRLAAALEAWGGRLVHVSTDCVFSGRKGRYTEDDPSDAEDLYGKSKALGEVTAPNAVTLRTSIIGRELKFHASLLDWFLLGGHARVKGFRRAFWSGVTTNHLAGVVADLLERHAGLAGLFHVSSGRLSKYDLLCLVRDGYGLGTVVEPDDSPREDRSLDGSRFAAAVGYVCPPWPQLIQELVGDPTPYAPPR
jgi:dTDP-4-dehydrorhamnose reductase